LVDNANTDSAERHVLDDEEDAVARPAKGANSVLVARFVEPLRQVVEKVERIEPGDAPLRYHCVPTRALPARLVAR
jgi:hypothetical protein